MKSKFLNEIVQELLKTGKYKEEDDKLMKDAEKIQKERIKKKDFKPEENSPVEEKFDDLESIKKELSKKQIPEINQLFKIFRNDEDMKKVFVAVFLNPVSRYGELKLEEEFKGRRKQAYLKLDKLKELKLIEFLSVIAIWEKQLRKEKSSKEEKLALKKFNVWSKTMTEKQRIFFRGRTNYYNPTEKGLDKILLNFIIGLKYD